MAISAQQRAEAWLAAALDEYYKEPMMMQAGRNRSSELPSTGRTIHVGKQLQTSLVKTYVPYTDVDLRRVATVDDTLVLDQMRYVADEVDIVDINAQPLDVVERQARNSGRALRLERNSFYVQTLLDVSADLAANITKSYRKADSASGTAPKWDTEAMRKDLVTTIFELYQTLYLQHWPVEGGGLYAYTPVQVWTQIAKYFGFDNPAALPGAWREGAMTGYQVPGISGLQFVMDEAIDFKYNSGADQTTAEGAPDRVFETRDARYGDTNTAATDTYPIIICPANKGFHYAERVYPPHRTLVPKWAGERTLLIHEYGAKVLQPNHVARLDFTLTA